MAATGLDTGSLPTRGASTPETEDQMDAGNRVAGYAALAAAVVGFLYSLSFVLLRNDTATALLLMLGGLLSVPAVLGLYRRLAVGQSAARNDLPMLGLALALAGAFGAAVHGAYDLSNALHPPAALNLDLPSQVDPRGFLTFGVAAFGALLLAWPLTRRAGGFPAGLGWLGVVLGVLLLVVYLARLIVLAPTSPLVLGPALVTGFVANPAWYAWLGVALLRRPARP